MKVMIQAFGSLGVIGGIVVGILLHYNKQTLAVWVSFSTVIFIALALCLLWQKSINENSKTTPEQKLENFLNKYFIENEVKLKKIFSDNYDVISISKDGKIVPLGKIDPDILSINWETCVVSIINDKIELNIPHFTFKGSSGESATMINITIVFEKKIGSTFQNIRSGNTRLIFTIVGEQENFYIIGVGLKNIE